MLGMVIHLVCEMQHVEGLQVYIRVPNELDLNHPKRRCEVDCAINVAMAEADVGSDEYKC